MKTSMVIFVVLLFATFLIADEGMWMPHQIKMLNLADEGLEMNPDDLYKADGTGLMSAVVDLGGGTGSFVSDKGLIFTNHHVAYGAIQRASTTEHNYLEDGFLANNLQEEILASGYTAGVLLNYEEVTETVHSKLNKKMSPMDRYNTIEKIKKELIAEAEKEASDMYAEIASVYSGNKYYIFKYKKIKDVRMVYAPPGALGNFGGETDNWMWPRHTCDFTFLRAYVSPEGLGVEYSKDNVPYEPKIHFKISKDGAKENDFTFIMGYPGKTYRNFSTPEVVRDIKRLKSSIKDRLEYIEFFEKAGKDNKDIEIKYASKVKGLYNGLKNYRGKLEGFQKINLIEKKKAADLEIEKWVKAKKSRKKDYKKIVKRIDDFLNGEYKKFSDKESGLSGITSSYYGPALIAKAHLLTRIAIEGEKPDAEREAYYQTRNLPNIKRRLQFAERSYDKNIDEKYTVLVMDKFINKNKENLPKFMEKLKADNKSIDAWAKDVYGKTQLGETKFSLSLIGKTPAELIKINDPLINFAFEMEKEISVIREKKHEMSQKLSDFKKVYKKALLEMRNNHLAPDANSTIRFTSGFIRGYEQRDGVYYKPLTTLKGVIEKDTGEKPFNTPEKIKTLYKNHDFGNYIDEKLGNVPACFLSTTNVTGGNSGSPAINGKGEVVGIIFDMTYESVTGDYYIVPEMQRVINADIRYILFVTEKFSEANYLIEEMGLK